MPTRDSVAAGAAIGAARDAGLDLTGQATTAIIVAKKIERDEANKAAKAKAAPTPMPADSLDLPPRSAQQQADSLDYIAHVRHDHDHKAKQPKQAGVLLKLARFLNLK